MLIPKVSVIVPIYNARKTLDKCIRSILNQSFKDIELILVNDGSKDNSLEICNKYAKIDKRIIIIDKDNEGSIKTRKKGVEVSKSKYIMFVDADDWIDVKTVEVLYNESIENCTDITVCNSYKVLSNRAIIKKKNNSRYFKKDKIYEGNAIKTELVEAYLYGHPFPSSLWAKLYKRELLINSGKYLNRIHFLGDDLFYNLEIFLKAIRVKVIDISLYYYRVGGATSRYMPYMFVDAVNGYEIQKEVIEEHFVDEADKQYNGISIMLLNTFKTCLYNCFNSNFDELKIKEMINTYTQNNNIIEALDNDGVKRYFETEYLLAIKNKDVDYLYNLGKKIYRQRILRQLLVNMLSKLQIV